MSKSKGFNKKTVMLRESLEKAEKEYNGKIDVLSMTALTNPAKVSSSRNIMFSSHLNQRVNLENTEFPLLSRGIENDVGELSTGYEISDSDLEVYEIVEKYRGVGNPNNVYTMFVYDTKRKCYDIIDKQLYEELTERYGYSYNYENLDNKKVGDTIPEGEVIYRSSGYDEHMNYGYGINSKFAYLGSMATIEDAIVVSESLSERMKSKEMETVRVSINDNDILINLYGGEEDFRGFPDVGMKVKKNVVCAKRRIHNSQLLYDLRDDNLNRINTSSDIPFYYDGTVYDVRVFSNKSLDEIPKNVFNKQIIEYIEMQNEYYQSIVDVCDEIYETGEECSSDLNFIYKHAKEVLDPDTKWQDERGSVFSNIILEISISRDIGVGVGQKITGRYGNKGVVSRVVPDDQMPILSTGEAVDVIFNPMGVVNRLNPEQLFEMSITFIMSRVRERMQEMLNNDSPYVETTDLLVSIVKYFNKEQARNLQDYIYNLPETSRKVFVHDVIEKGLPIVQQPMWEEEPLFYVLKRLYDEQPWIKPHEVYYNRFGRIVKGMRPLIVGDMYVLKLKQSSAKGFSARSTGPITRRGLPDKTQRRQNHQDSFSRTPIRIGNDENNNLNIGVSPDVLSELHMLYRSSVIGRQLLSKNLATPGLEWDEETITSDTRVTNRNAEILRAFMLVMGLRLEFDDEDIMDIHDNSDVRERINPMTGKKVMVNDRDYAYLRLEKEMHDEGFLTTKDYIRVYSREEFNRLWNKELRKRFLERFGYN